MKLLPFVLIAALIGAGIGVAIAYVEVGEVEETFAPPAMASAGVSTAGGKGSSSTTGVTQTAYPKVVAAEPEYDFGTMQRGTTETHEFILTNRGEAPLTLEAGTTSCKCTLSDVASQPLQPGASAPVKLEWTAKIPAGHFEQTATIHTNDPRQPRLELKVRGEVVETVGLEPREFLLGQMTTDDRRTASVYLAAYGEKTMEATARMAEGAPNADLFEFSVKSIPAADLPLPGATSGVRIDLTVAPGLPLGRLAEWTVIETNLEEVGSVQVPAVGVVEGDISLHGRGWAKNLGLLSLGKVRSKKGVEAKLIISFKGENATDAKATVGSVDPEWLEVEMGESRSVRDGVTHQAITIRIPPGQASVIRSGQSQMNGGQGRGDARIELKTNQEKTPEIDVRVRFIIVE